MNRLASPVRPPKLDEEDSSYVLRELELNAFSAVVSAMRAQGVLNNFKEVVLESLKCLFFIPDEIYKAEIKKAANDEFLTRVATVLNPSYDTFTPWGMVCRESDEDRPYFPPAHLFDTKEATSSTRSVADLLLQEASSHNDVVAGHDAMLISLLQTPKTPFVPEKLRKLLRDTESLTSERLLPRTGDRDEQMFLNRVILRKPPPPKVTLLPKRKRKMRQNGYKEEIPYEEEKYEIPLVDKPSTSTAPPVHLSPSKQDSTSALLNMLPTKESEALGVKELMNKIQAQMEQEQRNGMLETNGRRKRRPRAAALPKELQPECARARPFRFNKYTPDKMPADRSPLKRPATPGATPAVVQPKSPPVSNGSIPAQVIPQATMQASGHLHGKASPRHPPAAAMNTTPGHKENTSVHLRQLPSTAGVGSTNHVIGRVPSVPPATTPTGVIKRPRVASFTESNKLTTTSPVDLTQRSTALRKATYLPPTTTPGHKVKVAVTPPVEVHGQAMPTIPNSKAVYPHTVAVTVNRPQNRSISISKDGSGMTVIAPRSATISTPQTSATVNELHGHDYSLPKPATLVKKTVITTPGATARIINGGQTIVHKAIPSTSNHPTQIVSQQVVNVVKKMAPQPPVALTASAPAPLITTVHRPSPGPNAIAVAPGAISRKFITTTPASSPTTANQISVGQYLRKVATSSPQPSASTDDGPPPVKRVFYCDPNNPTVATVHTEPITPREEKKDVGEASTPSAPVPRLYKIAAPRVDGQIFTTVTNTKVAPPSSDPLPQPSQQSQDRSEVIPQQSLMEIT